MMVVMLGCQIASGRQLRRMVVVVKVRVDDETDRCCSCEARSRMIWMTGTARKGGRRGSDDLEELWSALGDFCICTKVEPVPALNGAERCN